MPEFSRELSLDWFTSPVWFACELVLPLARLGFVAGHVSQHEGSDWVYSITLMIEILGRIFSKYRLGVTLAWCPISSYLLDDRKRQAPDPLPLPNHLNIAS
ncbi:hypothetical protein PTI98_008668 [Pleurotus ostreatus]|nr:hypothetical protein PTI98_008668 [Pleurotus ostreatus]